MQPENIGPSLKISDRRRLQIPEPSGLSFFRSEAVLWTVSDQSGTIYKIDTSGKILGSLNINGNDLEAICYNHFTNELLIVEENLAEIVRLDTLGNIKGRTQILDTHDNSGLEGVCIDVDGNVFVLKEKDPGLFIALNPDFSIRESIELKFASDYSDITCDTTSDRFWIVCDKDRKIFLRDKSAGVIEEFNIPVINPEGIAVDCVNKRFYVVSDSGGELFILIR